MRPMLFMLCPLLACPSTPSSAPDAGPLLRPDAVSIDAGSEDGGRPDARTETDGGTPLQLPPAFEERWVSPLADESSASPWATDLNGDGILDIVLGTGTEAARGSVEALSGINGGSLWRSSEAGESLFTLPLAVDLDGDDIDELVIGGRGAELLALNARTGAVLWTFEPRGNSARDAGYFNFYSPQELPDLDDDGIPARQADQLWRALPSSVAQGERRLQDCL